MNLGQVLDTPVHAKLVTKSGLLPQGGGCVTNEKNAGMKGKAFYLVCTILLGLLNTV